MTDWNPPSGLSGLVTSAADAPGFWVQGCHWAVLASSDQTGGQYSLIEQRMPTNIGPPPHVHERQIEVFYILEGEMRLQLGDQTRDGGPGTLVHIPPRTPHGFTVLSETARVLNLYVPAALDTQISMLGTPATELTLPPAGAEHPPTVDQTESFLNRIRDLATQTLI